MTDVASRARGPAGLPGQLLAKPCLDSAYVYFSISNSRFSYRTYIHTATWHQKTCFKTSFCGFSQTSFLAHCGVYLSLLKVSFYINVCAALYYSQLPAHQYSLMAVRAIPYSACCLGPPSGNGTQNEERLNRNHFIQLAFADKADMRFKPENRKDPLTMICI